MSYYFYILRCFDNTLYCGQTDNLQRRLKEHNFDKHKSAKYLRGRTPVKLVYCEKHPTLQDAMRGEPPVNNRQKITSPEFLLPTRVFPKKTPTLLPPPGNDPLWEKEKHYWKNNFIN